MFPNQNYHGRFYVTRSGNLEISDVKEEDEGVYICLALSQSGNIQAEAQLTVIGKGVYINRVFFWHHTLYQHVYSPHCSLYIFCIW